MKFVLLADLHNRRYGPHNEKLFAAIEAEKPDFILSAGDLITSVPELSMEPAEELVRNLAERYPFYYANGNHEYRIYHDPEKFGGMGAEYRSVLEKSGVCLLENQSVVMADEGIRIYGWICLRAFTASFAKLLLKGGAGSDPGDGFQGRIPDFAGAQSCLFRSLCVMGGGSDPFGPCPWGYHAPALAGRGSIHFPDLVPEV